MKSSVTNGNDSDISSLIKVGLDDIRRKLALKKIESAQKTEVSTSSSNDKKRAYDDAVKGNYSQNLNSSRDKSDNISNSSVKSGDEFRHKKKARVATHTSSGLPRASTTSTPLVAEKIVRSEESREKKEIIAASQQISDINTTRNKTASNTTTDNNSNRSKPLSQALRQPVKVKRGDWNFEVDYNDHFETPDVAYSDLLPMIDSWCKLNGKTRESVIIYDPYYCKGKVIDILKSNGFHNVINENQDFYKDIKDKTIPNYDILITNPPYSGEHKQQLLKYLLSNMKPFALLLPAYTASKSYWRDFENEKKKSVNRQNNSKPAAGFCYLMPSSSYEYSHPEGTGKDIPPFYSCWLCHGLARPLKSGPSEQTSSIDYVYSVDEMIARKYIKGEKRPNPKQRMKLKAKLLNSNYA